MNLVIVTSKSWNIVRAEQMKQQYEGKHKITVITDPSQLNHGLMEQLKPDYIFFPHWSYIVPEEIYECWECVIFHMTDLPFGRGGSPLQNLVTRGFKKTKISALKAVKELDAGPIYMKEDLDLNGNADEILRRASQIIFQKMIPAFLEKKLEPYKQTGVITIFKRRKPEQSELPSDMKLGQVYDYIRMLDGEGYPKAFIPFGDYHIIFSNAQLIDGKLTATVEFSEE